MKLEYFSTTFPDGLKARTIRSLAVTDDLGSENDVINVYPQVRYQTFEGFGGAFTESAAFVYSKLDEAQKRHVVQTYFSKECMGYRLGRIHLDSSDFSLGHYEAMSDADDRQMKTFSIGRFKQHVLPFIKDAQKVVGKPIELFASPWSPPGFMKTNGERNHGGKLRPEYRQFWADYVCRYIEELAKEGLCVRCLSVQNEPKAVQQWDSCIYTAEEEKVFLRDFLYPTLKAHGLDEEIYIWDHNKERVFERACEEIDDATDAMIAGLAFHWYSGDHFGALQLIREKFPTKKLAMSEACIEFYRPDSKNPLMNAQKYAHDMIGNFNAGMTSFYDWNLLLDSTGGPNHAGNLCDAPFMFDEQQKELIERPTLSYLWHFCHFVKPGAVRLGLSRFTGDLEATALENPDGLIAIVILNRTERKREIVLRVQGKEASATIEAQSIATLKLTR